MHPAYSIIFFTTASGLGYGLLAAFGVYAALGLVPASVAFGVVTLGAALGLVTFGLLSSTFHLGHPERAWRAFSQWRSSWLSREGVMAVATYVPAGLLGLGWLLTGAAAGWWALCALLAAVGSAITVYCTSMIYASLQAVPRWDNPLVPVNYLLLAAMTGLLAFDAVLRLFGAGRLDVSVAALIVVALAWATKARYWAAIDGAAPAATIGGATGLGGEATIRLLESPHTTANYLQREMGYVIARKHARKLRRIAVALAFLAPLVLEVAIFALPASGATAAACLAALAALAGVVVERWLFFAEAEHAVTLYYGRAAV
jgi:DMSO reductase anchor subunit